MLRCRRLLSLGGLLALGCSSSELASSHDPPIDPAPRSLAQAQHHPQTLARPSPATSATFVARSRRANGLPSILTPSRPLAPTDGSTPEAAARAHLAHVRQRFPSFGDRTHVLRFRGSRAARRRARVAFFDQMHEGVPVAHSRTSVLMNERLELLGVFGGPHHLPVSSKDVVGSAQQALRAALRHHLGPEQSLVALSPVGADSGGFQRFARADQPSSGREELLRVRRIYFPGGSELIPAFELELMTERPELKAARYIVSAEDDTILEETNLKFDAHTYRVWANDSGGKEPWGAPETSLAPHPTGRVEGFEASALPAKLITLDGFNTNPEGTIDPWLAEDATTTTGNNVEAYANLDGQQGFSAANDLRPQVTSPGIFDLPYDLDREPLATDTQAAAAAVQLFYTTNWLHDWYYDSGFVEEVGNAQRSNFGRGGADADPLIAEAMVGALAGQLNNAQMLPFAEGASPLMQIFVWAGPSVRSLTLDPGGLKPTGSAEFGPTTFAISGPVELVDDGAGMPADACDGTLGSLTGQVALIDRGDCAFIDKVTRAEAAGAIAVIIGNSEAGPPPAMAGTAPGITIPVLSLSQDDAGALKTALGSGTVTATLNAESRPQRSGSLDGGIVAHEWGHYMHGRLADVSTPQGLAMGEGWGDFIALHLLFDEGDDPEDAYVMGGYAARAVAPDSYFGVRRAPYSRSFDINPLTFHHITSGQALPTDVPFYDFGVDNAEIHNAGEIWASMMFDAYTEVIDETKASGGSFQEARRAMSDYVVLGLLLQPPQATFTEARDALIAAAAAEEPAHAEAIARAFARRGAGSCAVSPPRESEDFAGLTESFTLAPSIVVENVEIVDRPQCTLDEDGLLDVGEEGYVRVTLTNVAFGTATDVEVSLDEQTSAPPAIFLGETALSATLGALESATLEFPIELEEELAEATPLPLVVRVNAPGACEGNSEFRTRSWVAVDRRLGAEEDFESGSTFTPEGAQADRVWAFEQSTDGANTAYHGANLERVSDTALVSPALEISETEPFSISFSHRFSFETDQGETWDGGVIEVTNDDGASWVDASSFTGPGLAAPDYTGSVSLQGNNPLRGRAAYVAENDGYPASVEETVDFGSTLAGDTVRLRFRIASDELMGAAGWSIDQVTVVGITNVPLSSLVTDTADDQPDPPGECLPPVVETGGSGGTASETGGTGSGGLGAGGTPEVGGTGASTPATGGVTTGGSGGQVSAPGSGGESGAGTAGAGATGGVDSASGCGCRQDGGAGRTPRGLSLLLALAGLAFWRRRRPFARAVIG